MTQRIDFRQSLKEAKAELSVLQEELGENFAVQEELEKKIVAVRQMIVAFSNALGEQFEEADELGLTDAIRQAIKTHKGPLEPTAVRTRLQELGFNTKKYGNLMASIHTVLGRLTQRAEVRMQNIGPGKSGYVWVEK